MIEYLFCSNSNLLENSVPNVGAVLVFCLKKCFVVLSIQGTWIMTLEHSHVSTYARQHRHERKRGTNYKNGTETLKNSQLSLHRSAARWRTLGQSDHFRQFSDDTKFVTLHFARVKTRQEAALTATRVSGFRAGLAHEARRDGFSAINARRMRGITP